MNLQTEQTTRGVVLYEMLTGSPLFAAETISETLAAVLTKEINWEKVPANVSSLLHRCLQKDLNNRLRDIGDVKLDLEEILANLHHDVAKPDGTLKPPKKRISILPWMAAAILLGTITIMEAWHLKKNASAQLICFHYDLRQNQFFADLFESEIAISRDGKKIAYSANDGLYLQAIDEPNARLIPQTGRNITRPFFSPDSKWIAYSQGNELNKIAISGGQPVPLIGGISMGSCYWGSDNSILYSVNGRGIMRISSGKSTPYLAIKDDKGTIVSPEMLPDLDSVIFAYSDNRPFKIFAQSLRSGKRKELIEGIQAKYLPTGHLVYAIENNLFAVRFNLNTLETEGAPVRVVEDIYRIQGVPQYAVSDTGTLIYVPVPARSLRTPFP